MRFILLIIMSVLFIQIANANYVDIGAINSGVKYSINTDQRYLKERNFKYDDYSGDTVYQFWNKEIFSRPTKKVLCFSNSPITCVNKEVFIKNITYLSSFNLTKNTYCDDISQYYDKNGNLVYKEDNLCEYVSSYKPIEPGSSNEILANGLRLQIEKLGLKNFSENYQFVAHENDSDISYYLDLSNKYKDYGNSFVVLVKELHLSSSDKVNYALSSCTIDFNKMKSCCKQVVYYNSGIVSDLSSSLCTNSLSKKVLIGIKDVLIK